MPEREQKKKPAPKEREDVEEEAVDAVETLVLRSPRESEEIPGGGVCYPSHCSSRLTCRSSMLFFQRNVLGTAKGLRLSFKK